MPISPREVRWSYTPSGISSLPLLSDFDPGVVLGNKVMGPIGLGGLTVSEARVLRDGVVDSILRDGVVDDGPEGMQSMREALVDVSMMPSPTIQSPCPPSSPSPSPSPSPAGRIPIQFQPLPSPPNSETAIPSRPVYLQEKRLRPFWTRSLPYSLQSDHSGSRSIRVASPAQHPFGKGKEKLSPRVELPPPRLLYPTLKPGSRDLDPQELDGGMTAYDFLAIESETTTKESGSSPSSPSMKIKGSTARQLLSSTPNRRREYTGPGSNHVAEPQEPVGDSRYPSTVDGKQDNEEPKWRDLGSTGAIVDDQNVKRASGGGVEKILSREEMDRIVFETRKDREEGRILGSSEVQAEDVIGLGLGLEDKVRVEKWTSSKLEMSNLYKTPAKTMIDNEEMMFITPPKRSMRSRRIVGWSSGGSVSPATTLIETPGMVGPAARSRLRRSKGEGIEGSLEREEVEEEVEEDDGRTDWDTKTVPLQDLFVTNMEAIEIEEKGEEEETGQSGIGRSGLVPFLIDDGIFGVGETEEKRLDVWEEDEEFRARGEEKREWKGVGGKGEAVREMIW